MVSISDRWSIISNHQVKPKLIEWLFYTVAFTLPFLRAHWNSKVIVLLILVSIFQINIKELWLKIRVYKIFWLFASLFFLDVVGLIHTQNLNYGFRYLETKIPILVFPFLILINLEILNRKIIDNICKSFFSGVLVILAGYTVIILREVLKNGLTFASFLNERLSDIPAIANQTIIDIHPSFLSLYLSLFGLYILIYFRTKPPKSKIWILSTLLLLIIFFQIWLNSRAGLIGFVLVTIFFVFFQTNRKNKILSLWITLLFLAGLLSIPVARERFVFAPIRAMQNIGEVNVKDPVTWPISFRFQIFDCSIDLLENNNWILGYGTGDFRDKINQCFSEKEYGWLIVREFDAHNEYFSQLHRHGIIGLILFLACLVIPLKDAFHAKQTLYIVFLLLIIISALPETILSSQKGVVFYALFNSLLYLRSIALSNNVSLFHDSEK